MAKKNQLQWALETWNEGRKTARRPPSFGWFVFQKSSLRVHPCTGSGKAGPFCALISRKVNAVSLVGFGNSSAFHSHLISVVGELQHAWGSFRTLTGEVTDVPKHGNPLNLLVGCRKRLFATCSRNSWIKWQGSVGSHCFSMNAGGLITVTPSAGSNHFFLVLLVCIYIF